MKKILILFTLILCYSLVYSQALQQIPNGFKVYKGSEFTIGKQKPDGTFDMTNSQGTIVINGLVITGGSVSNADSLDGKAPIFYSDTMFVNYCNGCLTSVSSGWIAINDTITIDTAWTAKLNPNDTLNLSDSLQLAWVEINNLDTNVWKVTGNAGTDTSVNFVGTIDDMPLRFKINNINYGLIGADNNNFFGFYSGYSITHGTGSGNNFIGFSAGYANTIGSGNNFIGFAAGRENISGIDNIFIGNQAGYSHIIGNKNIAIGYMAGYHQTNLNNRIYLGTKDYGSLANDTILTPIYINDSNSVSQIYLNGVTHQKDTLYVTNIVGKSDSILLGTSYFTGDINIASSGYYTDLQGTTTTVDRIITLPDKDGQVLLNSDTTNIDVRINSKADTSAVFNLGTSNIATKATEFQDNVLISTGKSLTIKDATNNDAFKIIDNGDSTKITSTNNITIMNQNLTIDDSTATNGAVRSLTIRGTGINNSKLFLSHNRSYPSFTTPNGYYLGEIYFSGCMNTARSFSVKTFIRVSATETYSTSANGSKFSFFNVANATVTSLERLTINQDGNIGFGATTPNYSLSFIGTDAKTIGVERHTTANTAGNNLTIRSGGATSGSTDKNSGNLQLSSSTSTGTGFGYISLLTTTAGSTGTTDRTATEKVRITSGGDVLILANTNGIILKDDAGTAHYWRVTISSLGVLTTTDLGTTEPQ